MLMVNDTYNTCCSACSGKLKNRGNISDGDILTCESCGSSKLGMHNYESLKNQTGYGEAYLKALNPEKVNQLEYIYYKINPELMTGASLLDIGFGSGDFINRLYKKGWNVAGVDCNHLAVEKIKSEGIDGFYGELGSEMNVDKTFDIITLWDVIEHIYDIDKAMHQLNKLVKNDGKIFVITPNADSILDTIGNLERNIFLGRSHKILDICLNRFHLQRFSENGIKILFERCGFRVESISKIRLFSLKPDVYSKSFAPGIKSWTNISSLNGLISRFLYKLLELFNIKNKILLIASKNKKYDLIEN